MKGQWLPKMLGFRGSASTMGWLHAPCLPLRLAPTCSPGGINHPIWQGSLGEAKSCLQLPSKPVPGAGAETYTSQLHAMEDPCEGGDQDS